MFRDHILIPKERIFKEKPQPESLSLIGITSEESADLWTNGVVPYELNANVPQDIRALVTNAIADFHSKTPIRFVPKTSNHMNYMHVSVDPQEAEDEYGEDTSRWPCGFAGLGMYTGRNLVWLNTADRCYKDFKFQGIVTHEIGHLVGMHHEFDRCDRDDHLDFSNIKESWASRFPGPLLDCSEGSYYTNYTQFDQASVMNYDSYLFSVADQLHLPVVMLKNPTAEGDYKIRKGSFLTRLDAIGISYMYRNHGAPIIDILPSLEDETALEPNEVKTITFNVSDTSQRSGAVNCATHVQASTSDNEVIPSSELRVSHLEGDSQGKAATCRLRMKAKSPGIATINLKFYDGTPSTTQTYSQMEFDVEVSSIDNPPSAIVIDRTQIPSTTLKQNVIARIYASDCDRGDTHSFVLSGADSDKMIIMQTNVLQAARDISSGPLNFTITATDRNGGSKSQNFRIDVVNQTDLPHASPPPPAYIPTISNTAVSGTGPWKSDFSIAPYCAPVRKYTFKFGDGSEAVTPTPRGVSKYWYRPGSKLVEFIIELANGRTVSTSKEIILESDQ